MTHKECSQGHVIEAWNTNCSRCNSPAVSKEVEVDLPIMVAEDAVEIENVEIEGDETGSIAPAKEVKASKKASKTDK
jgi:hypothetical protein